MAGGCPKKAFSNRRSGQAQTTPKRTWSRLLPGCTAPLRQAQTDRCPAGQQVVVLRDRAGFGWVYRAQLNPFQVRLLGWQAKCSLTA